MTLRFHFAMPRGHRASLRAHYGDPSVNHVEQRNASATARSCEIAVNKTRQFEEAPAHSASNCINDSAKGTAIASRPLANAKRTTLSANSLTSSSPRIQPIWSLLLKALTSRANSSFEKSSNRDSCLIALCVVAKFDDVSNLSTASSLPTSSARRTSGK